MVVKHAFGLAEDPKHPGRYFPVHLKNVIAESYEHLEPNDNSTHPAYALVRLQAAMEQLHTKRKWGE